MSERISETESLEVMLNDLQSRREVVVQKMESIQETYEKLAKDLEYYDHVIAKLTK